MGLDVYPRYGNSIQQTGIQAGLFYEIYFCMILLQWNLKI